MSGFTNQTYTDFPWAEIIARIRAGDESAGAELYKKIKPGLRYLISRRLGFNQAQQECDDILQETFAAGIYAIRRGAIIEPNALLGYFRQIMNCQIAQFIASEVRNRKYCLNDDVNVMSETIGIADPKANPEVEVIIQEERRLMSRALAALNERDREILTRFYLLEQSVEQVQHEMNLTPTQFRLMKNRAKAKFGQRARNLIATKEICRIRAKRAAMDDRPRSVGMVIAQLHPK